MELFYNPELRESTIEWSLKDQEARHLVKVLRKQPGDEIFATNGSGLLVRSTILSSRKSEVQLKVIDCKWEELAKPTINVSLGILHHADRLEFAVEKAVELGATQIYLVRTQFVQLKGKLRLERLEKKAIAAIKQSNRLYIPHIVEINFKQWLQILKQNHDHLILFGHEIPVEGTVRAKISNLLHSNSSDVRHIELFIGPEGGISEEEVASLLTIGAKPVQLGKHRLRAETASIAAIAQIRAALD